VGEKGKMRFSWGKGGFHRQKEMWTPLTAEVGMETEARSRVKNEDVRGEDPRQCSEELSGLKRVIRGDEP